MIKRNLVSSDDREIGFYLKYPQHHEGYDEFHCEFGTFGFSRDINVKTVGGDALQSLLLALARIEMFITGTEEFESLNLRCVGAWHPGDLGLRIPGEQPPWTDPG